MPTPGVSALGGLRRAWKPPNECSVANLAENPKARDADALSAVDGRDLAHRRRVAADPPGRWYGEQPQAAGPRATEQKFIP